MSKQFTNKFIYTDYCNDKLRTKIFDELQLSVIVRAKDTWDISYITKMLTDPSLSIVIINQIDEQSIAEISIAAFMCKQILVTSKALDEYPNIKILITDEEIGCNLNSKNSTFISWYNYTSRR